MTKHKWITAVAVLTLGTSLAIAGPGERHRKGGHEGDGRHAAKFAEKLNLTEAQKAQIKQIRQNNHEQNKAFYESARETRHSLRAAKKANDTARLEALKGQMESQRAQMKQLHESVMTQINAILTAEQKAQFAAMKADREARKGRHHQHDGNRK